MDCICAEKRYTELTDTDTEVLSYLKKEETK